MGRIGRLWQLLHNYLQNDQNYIKTGKEKRDRDKNKEKRKEEERNANQLQQSDLHKANQVMGVGNANTHGFNSRNKIKWAIKSLLRF